MAATIESENPVIVPPAPAKTYPFWWVEMLTILAPDLNGRVNAQATFRRYMRDATTGAGEFSPDGQRAQFSIDDLFALAATDTEVADLVNRLIAKIGTLAKAAGSID